MLVENMKEKTDSERNINFLELIFGGGIYFYAITILFQYGYNSYFHIPSNFIEPSIRDNVLFFFALMHGFFQGFDRLSLGTLIGLGILVFLNFFLFFLLKRKFALIYKIIIIIFISSFTVVSLFLANNFGDSVAKSQKDFLVIPDGCLPIEGNVTYIIPSYYQDLALIISKDREGGKLTNSFIAKNISDLNCTLVRTAVGPLTR